MIENTTNDKFDPKVIHFLGGLFREREFLPDYFIFEFEYNRVNFSQWFGFLK